MNDQPDSIAAPDERRGALPTWPPAQDDRPGPVRRGRLRACLEVLEADMAEQELARQNAKTARQLGWIR